MLVYPNGNPIMQELRSQLMEGAEFGSISAHDLGETAVTTEMDPRFGGGMMEPRLINGVAYTDSFNPNDVPAGTGISSLKIVYLDENMNGFFEETIAVNGMVKTTSVNSNICYMERIVAVTYGGGTAAPSVTADVPGLTGWAAIASSIESNLGFKNSHHYIRPGKTCYITDLQYNEITPTLGRAFTVILRFRPLGWPLYITDNPPDGIEILRVRAYPNQNAKFTKFSTPIAITGPGRIQMYVQQDTANNVPMVASFNYFER